VITQNEVYEMAMKTALHIMATPRAPDVVTKLERLILDAYERGMNDLRTSKELVKSLRDYSEGPTFYWGPICQKAAEEIERLQRELAASAAQYQEACDDANRFARERDEARASPEPFDELERYKRALYQANGMLIQLDKEPVKLDYSSVTKGAAQ
jgi:hypothetical protein